MKGGDGEAFLVDLLLGFFPSLHHPALVQKSLSMYVAILHYYTQWHLEYADMERAVIPTEQKA